MGICSQRRIKLGSSKDVQNVYICIYIYIKTILDESAEVRKVTGQTKVGVNPFGSIMSNCCFQFVMKHF